MNQDERRALKILHEKGIFVSEDEFNKWCMGKKAYYHSSAGCLWHPTPQKMADEFISERTDR